MGWKRYAKKLKKVATTPLRMVKKITGGGDARSEAALQKVTGPTTKQAGAGAITYNEEKYV